jgi:hypothetical protein
MQLFGRNDTEVLAQVTNVLTAVGVSVSSANINTGGGEGPVRDVFRVTDDQGNKVGVEWYWPGRATCGRLRGTSTNVCRAPAAAWCAGVPWRVRLPTRPADHMLQWVLLLPRSSYPWDAAVRGASHCGGPHAAFGGARQAATLGPCTPSCPQLPPEQWPSLRQQLLAALRTTTRSSKPTIFGMAAAEDQSSTLG